jgi:formate hydrogenlyase subunit 3/multisubunit Na+/H+ antiporter MnhD subunit
MATTGGIMQLAAHAFAKAAMFLAAGLIAERLGHDRIDGLGGVAQAMPTTFFALALAGVSLMGLPPSGGFSAKWMLLTASAAEGQWWWAVVILAGGLIAAAYIFRVVGMTLAAPAEPLPPAPAAARPQEWAALGLAAIAILLGLLPLDPWPLLEIGRETGGAP